MHIRKGTRHRAHKKKLKTVKNMYLVRKKHPNKDKENNWVETFEQALALIGQTKENINQSVSWLNYIDYFFLRERMTI